MSVPYGKAGAWDMQKTINVAVYRRFKPDGIDQEASHALMKAYYEKFIGSRPDWQFAGYYSDEGSGKAGLQKLLQDCETGQIGMVVTKSLSRFAENMADGLRIIRQLKNLKPPVGIYFECENLNTLDDWADKWLLQWMMIF